jgi:protein-tyrosine phosphatase
MEFTLIPFIFSGDIFRSAMPFSSYDPEGELIKTYITNDVSMVVMLAGEVETKKVTGRNLVDEYEAQGFKVICLPIPDFGVPEVPALRDTISQVLTHSKLGDNITIHCHAGIGRTGMFMACLAKIGKGFSPEESIQWVRRYLPDAIEVPEQEQMVRMV